MGMAASQARFLQLTARLSDNEFEAQQISQERLALTQQMEQFANDYEKATTNQVMLVKVFENQGATESETVLTYDTIVNDQLNGGLGMKLTTASGLIAVPSEEAMRDMLEKDGSLSESDFTIISEIKDPTTLQRNLQEGNLYISIPNTNAEEGEDKWLNKSPAAIGSIRTTYDTTDDAAAKAIYDKRMALAEKKDAIFEMKLNQLESEHKAIETEMDSVQKIVDDNVESSFKTFG